MMISVKVRSKHEIIIPLITWKLLLSVLKDLPIKSESMHLKWL